MNQGGRHIVGVGLALLAVMVIIRGRALAFSLTEGEALVALWPVWLLGGVLAVLAVVVLTIKA